MKKDLMEARESLNSLERKYEELEIRYDDIDGYLMEIEEESA